MQEKLQDHSRDLSSSKQAWKLLLSCDPQDICQSLSIFAKNNGGKLHWPDVWKCYFTY